MLRKNVIVFSPTSSRDVGIVRIKVRNASGEEKYRSGFRIQDISIPQNLNMFLANMFFHRSQGRYSLIFRRVSIVESLES
jgi:hypothetical protein